MAYCSQCGADCANAAYCPQCGAAVGTGVSASSNEQNSNPFAVGAQISEYSGRNYEQNAPEIPGFVGAIAICFKKYCCFKGRASRSEFWYWVLFNVLVASSWRFAGDDYTLYRILTNICCLWGCVALLPNVAASVRRFHDIGHSGWEVFIVLGVELLLIVLVGVAGALDLEACGSTPPLRQFGVYDVILPILQIILLVGVIYILVQCCRRGTEGENRFGLAPRRRD